MLQITMHVSVSHIQSHNFIYFISAISSNDRPQKHALSNVTFPFYNLKYYKLICKTDGASNLNLFNLYTHWAL